jgi:hypothetical protein
MMPAETRTVCDVCGAVEQQPGGFCEECGATIPDAAPVPAEPDTLDLSDLCEASESATPEPATPEPAEPGPPEWHDRARALIVPVAAPAAGPAERQAQPVLPGTPEPARPVVHLPGTDDIEAGSACPWCTARNPVDRHFCRRCGLLLSARPGPSAPRPWWRRLLDWRRREVPYAGQRPRLRRDPARLIRWGAVLVVVGVAAYAADTWGSTAVADVEDHFTHPASVFASTVTASRSDPGHPVADLHDSYNNTWWGTGESGDGAGTYVNATFAQPISLLDIVITPGAGVAQDAFTSQSRPQTIDVTLTQADGTTTGTTLTLTDSPGPETFAVHGDDVTSIRFTLESAYLASPGQDAEVAIAEIEFFAKP